MDYNKLPIEDKALIWSVIDALIEALDELKASEDDLIEVFTQSEILEMFEGRDNALNEMYQVFIDRSEVLQYYELYSVLKKLQKKL